jgi:hypothetical protein
MAASEEAFGALVSTFLVPIINKLESTDSAVKQKVMF